jgi:hypothetical protein
MRILVVLQMKVREISLDFATLSKVWVLDKTSTLIWSAMQALACEDMVPSQGVGRDQNEIGPGNGESRSCHQYRSHYVTYQHTFICASLWATYVPDWPLFRQLTKKIFRALKRLKNVSVIQEKRPSPTQKARPKSTKQPSRSYAAFAGSHL